MKIKNDGGDFYFHNRQMTDASSAFQKHAKAAINKQESVYL